MSKIEGYINSLEDWNNIKETLGIVESKEDVDPTITELLKFLLPLGKTLKVVDLLKK